MLKIFNEKFFFFFCKILLMKTLSLNILKIILMLTGSLKRKIYIFFKAQSCFNPVGKSLENPKDFLRICLYKK